MSCPPEVEFNNIALDDIAPFEGKLVVLLQQDAGMEPLARRVNRLAKGALARLQSSAVFNALKTSEGVEVLSPAGVSADSILVVNLPKRATSEQARKAGAWVAKNAQGSDLLLLGGSRRHCSDLAYGFCLRSYDFSKYKTDTTQADAHKLTMAVSRPEDVSAVFASKPAIAEGVFFTRDLTNEPANVLTTTEFAARLKALISLGVDVEVMQEAELKKLGMNALLAVGMGSESPSYVVVMKWNGGGSEAPFALVGKGVVFDTGGISLKPAAGMEDMTMDMGGAGVVGGVMKALALRKAKANVVGVVGLVENMPDGKAQRPGDIVTSMKGDTIEVINTDAEGRLVLADILWHTQEIFKPSAMVDLATLTGAVIIGLGHENAGVFSNNDRLCNRFLKAAQSEGEGAWRLPLSPAYDELIKSNIADIKNVGGRAAGSITAAQFLQRFVNDDTPWMHLDIAGVAQKTTDSDLAPKGATGWGVMALDRLIADHFENLTVEESE